MAAQFCSAWLTQNRTENEATFGNITVDPNVSQTGGSEPKNPDEIIFENNDFKLIVKTDQIRRSHRFQIVDRQFNLLIVPKTDHEHPPLMEILEFLEEIIILTLAEYNIKSTRGPGETGVWLDVGTPFARKICAMGVRASRWVTMHGFALNVNADLGYFDNIIPCGIRGKAVTSLQVELGVEKVDENEIKAKILNHFITLFDAEIINQTSIDPVII